MDGASFLKQIADLKNILAELEKSLGPITLSELKARLESITKDAGDATTYDGKPEPEKQQMEDRLARLREGIRNFHDGPTDAKNWMYKEYAGRWAIGSLMTLAFLFTVALLIAICLRWAGATVPAKPCTPEALNSGQKQEATAGTTEPKKKQDLDTDVKGKPSPTPTETPIKTGEKNSKGGKSNSPSSGEESGDAGKNRSVSPTGRIRPPKKTPPTPEKSGATNGEQNTTARVIPGASTLTTCQSVSLKLVGSNASYTWEDPATGTITQDGLYSAPSSITGTQTIKVYAKLKAGSTPNPTSETPFAIITLVTPGGPDESNVIVMVLLLGGLGGCLHWISSLVIFIGNRQFLRSWVVYYLFMPIEGAALAIIVYLLLRVGVLNPGVGNTANATASLNVISLYAFSGLTGIFSKQALQSLADIFSAMFKKVQAKDQPKTNSAGKS